MVLPSRFAPRLLAVLASSIVLGSPLFAQPAPAPGNTSTPVVAPYPSAFDGYRAYTEEPPANWKAANDTTARIGGWREYARQAQQPDNTPTPPIKAGATAPQAKP
ncbi:MAG: hypothetical protein WBK51_16435 [Polaromonas sp.]